MKRTGRRRTSRVMWTMILVAVVACASLLAYTGYSSATKHTAEQRDLRALTQKVDAHIAAYEAEKKKPVYITLPGAERITALVDDYEAQESIWVLVNKQRAVATDYVPENLTTPPLEIRPNATGDERMLRSELVKPLVTLFKDAESKGYALMIGSAYRSGATQQSLFNGYVASAGREEAEKYSAHPGHSEHQLGLAVDISTVSQSCYLSECFLGTPEGQWLAENAYKYGFTLRYPQGKETITGYNFEPWHFRYVGVDLATALRESNLTYEEAWPHLEAALAKLRQKQAL